MGLGNIGKSLIATAVGGPIFGANVYAAGEEKAAQDAANQQNIASAKEQQNFQERMANTSYQRAMKDMEAANLNPMLAFSQGGASSPAGSMATVAPSSTGMGRAVSKSISEGINAASSFTGMANSTASTQSTIGLQSAQAVNQQASAEQAQANIKKIEFDKLKTEADTTKILQDTKQSAKTFEDRSKIIELERKMKETDLKWQEPEKYINNGSMLVGAVTDAVGGLVGKAAKAFKGSMGPSQQGNSARHPPPSGRTKSYYNSQGEHRGTVEEKWNYPNY